ncbi:MAG: pilus assembly protein [Alphaproteobacteria bacterium]|nr:pilus assembly protein [Alphaproteobacteria bacterium]
MRDLRPRRRGSVALEFTLVLPILVLMLAGILELSWTISQLHVLSRAARDAARVGSVTLEGPNPDGTEIEAAAEAQGYTMLDGAGFACSTDPDCEVTAVWSVDGDTGWAWVDVTVTYPYNGFTGVLDFLGPDMRANFSMLTQQQVN